jgi:hypothetical protein
LPKKQIVIRFRGFTEKEDYQHTAHFCRELLTRRIVSGNFSGRGKFRGLMLHAESGTILAKMRVRNERAAIGATFSETETSSKKPS